MADLHGRVALVTGSSSGIGRSIAERLLADGATVAVHSRDQNRADGVATELTTALHQDAATGAATAVGFAADLSSPATGTDLVDAVHRRFGRLDILVNNAGVPMTAPSAELALADWERTVATNLTAPFVCAQAAGRHMLARGGGVIVNVASILAHTGIAERAAYATTKHGILGLTKVLAVEWAARGVRVVSVDPGYVATDFIVQTQRTASYSLTDLERRTPLGRVAQPAEIAAAVAFLVSDEATYVTGTGLLVDGGWTAYGGW